MANMRYAIGNPYTTSERGNFWVPTATVAESTQSGYSSDNVTVEHLAQNWRATGTGASWVGVNLGASRSVQAIFVEDLNFANVRVTLGNSSNVSSNSDFGTGNVSGLERNIRTGRYSMLATGTGTGQYAGVRIASQSTTDGGADFRVGRITVVETLNTLNTNWQRDYRYVGDAVGSSTRRPGGQVTSVATSQTYISFQVAGTWDIAVTANRTDAERFMSARQTDRVLHFENRSQTDPDQIHAYLCEPVLPIGIDEDFPSLRIQLSMREVI